jgi:hypothetical protein
MRLPAGLHLNRASPWVADILLATGLIGLDLGVRLLPHAWQFTPMIGTALFSAAALRVRPLALAVPVIALALSDSLVGFYDWRVMIVVYAASVLPAVLGLLLGRRSLPISLLLAAGSSLVFFATTNFAVWAFEGLYSHDAAGLAACYGAALPFLKNSLAGDLFWTCALFGGYGLLRAGSAKARARRNAVAA